MDSFIVLSVNFILSNLASTEEFSKEKSWAFYDIYIDTFYGQEKNILIFTKRHICVFKKMMLNNMLFTK